MGSLVLQIASIVFALSLYSNNVDRDPVIVMRLFDRRLISYVRPHYSPIYT